MPSARWNTLRVEVASLRRQFLPTRFDPLGTYSSPRLVQAHTRAFLVLSHAEIEGYLETWAKDMANAAERLWLAKGRVTPPLVFLLSCLAERLVLPSASAGGTQDVPQLLANACRKLFQKYYERVRDNHGIKEKNVLDLFSPLGLELAAIGPTLLPNLDSFGKLRGVHAHQPAKAVVSVLDPEIEYKRATDLLEDLKSLDAWLVLQRKRIR